MREIVHAQVGQCGNNVGAKFFEEVAKDHSIDPTGSHFPLAHDQVDVYFREIAGGRFCPRAVLFDLEPGAVDSLQSELYGHLFEAANCVQGLTGAGNNWAKGHYTEGPTLLETLMERIRRETEQCESLQGLQLFHSLGGGTGGGAGSLLLSQLTDAYPSQCLAAFSFLPTFSYSDVAPNIYSSVLSLNFLIELPHLVVTSETESLYRICFTKLHLRAPNHADLNRLLSAAATGVTAPLRFQGNSTLRRMAANLVPFPRTHFMSVGLAPVGLHRGSASEVLQQVFDQTSRLCDFQSDTHLAAIAVLRGADISLDQAERHYQGVSWLPDSLKVWSGPASATSACLLSNSVGQSSVFSRLLERFFSIYRRKAFLHWYLGEGMEEMEFDEAANNLQDLLAEYQQLE